VKDLPQPYATRFGGERRPIDGASGKRVASCAPEGFKVELFAQGSRSALAAYPPNGDVSGGKTHPGRIRVFRGMTADGKPDRCRSSRVAYPALWNCLLSAGARAAVDLHRRHNEVLRFPYHNGDLKAPAQSQDIADLPRAAIRRSAVEFSQDGKKMLWEWFRVECR